jgi:hypothetical protein
MTGLPAFFAVVRAVVEALGFFAIGYLDSDGDQSGVGALVVIAREDWAIAHGKKTTTTRQPAAIERLRAMATFSSARSPPRSVADAALSRQKRPWFVPALMSRMESRPTNDLSFQRKWAQGKSATLRFARSAHSENRLLPCKSERR